MYRLTAYFLKGLPIPSFCSYQEIASQCLFLHASLRAYVNSPLVGQSCNPEFGFGQPILLKSGEAPLEKETMTRIV